MEPRFVPLTTYREYPAAEMLARAASFRAELQRRRTVRQFSDRPVPREIIEECLLAAGTAPSGAHMQPWHFVAVADPDLKREIRAAAEREEHDFYHHRAPAEWLAALAPLGTDERKPYLEVAPWLIAVFARTWGVQPDGSHRKHYYVQESVGIATGMLVCALHHAGLATLTHTPSPMGFLSDLLGRPGNERAFLLLVAGYPAPDAVVPDLARRTLAELATFR
jgi:nitroreductase